VESSVETRRREIAVLAMSAGASLMTLKLSTRWPAFSVSWQVKNGTYCYLAYLGKFFWAGAWSFLSAPGEFTELAGGGFVAIACFSNFPFWKSGNADILRRDGFGI